MPAGSAMARRASAMDELLEKTALVDFDHPSIRDLVASRGWVALDEEAKIRSVYDFVRDEMRFGYNKDDAIPASRVLADGYGQCNTKGILLMALLRAVGVQMPLPWLHDRQASPEGSAERHLVPARPTGDRA